MFLKRLGRDLFHLSFVVRDNIYSLQHIIKIAVLKHNPFPYNVWHHFNGSPFFYCGDLRSIAFSLDSGANVIMKYAKTSVCFKIMQWHLL